MSEVNKFHAADDFTGELCVLATDFDAERALRLEAERQVGELREQLASYEAGFWSRMAAKSGIENRALQSKLDTTMAFIRRVAAPHSCGCVPCTGDCTSKLSLEIIIDEMRGDAQALLNTTSSEGKDHD